MIYLDNAATSKLKEEILDAYVSFNKKYFANASSSHLLGVKQAEFDKQARKAIASILDVKENEIIFTSGATESNNLAIKGTAFMYSSRGKHLITSKVEHPSVLEAFKFLETMGYEVTYLDVNENGEVSLIDLANEIREDTILVSLMSVNNEVGAINDIPNIAKLLKSHPKIIFHVDATQSIGKMDIDMKDVDLISMSMHKLGGFKASGILIKKEKINLSPLLSGGGQQDNLRSGTLNVGLELASSKTLRLAYETMKEDYKYVNNLRNHLFEELTKIEGIRFNSTLEGSPYIINISIPKKASVISEALSLDEIYVSTRSACSSKKESYSHVLKEMGRSSLEASNALRISLSRENTLEEINYFIQRLKHYLETIK